MMNRWIQLGGLVAAIVLLTGCTTEVTLSVPDMMCEDGCAVQVSKILSQQPGVKRVNVDFPNRVATLAVDKSKFNTDGTVAALVDHGFTNSKLKTNDAPVTPTASATSTQRPDDTRSAPSSAPATAN